MGRNIKGATVKPKLLSLLQDKGKSHKLCSCLCIRFAIKRNGTTTGNLARKIDQNPIILTSKGAGTNHEWFNGIYNLNQLMGLFCCVTASSCCPKLNHQTWTMSCLATTTVWHPQPTFNHRKSRCFIVMTHYAESTRLKWCSLSIAEMPLRCISLWEERTLAATAILRFKLVKARMVLQLRATGSQTGRKWKVLEEVDKAISRLKPHGVSTKSKRVEKTLEESSGRSVRGRAAAS